jgi:uncharacterized protein involved in exopolysaccharide biosynthesis
MSKLKGRSESTERVLVQYDAPRPVAVPRALYANKPRNFALIDAWDTLQRRWILASSLFATVLAIGLTCLMSLQVPVYRAEATIFVPPDGRDPAAQMTFVNQQILILLHYQTLSEVIHRLQDQGVNWRTARESEQEAVNRLLASLDIEPIPNSYEISVAAITRSPREAALIANTIAQTYLDEQSQPGTAGHVDRVTQLNIEKANLTKELGDLLAQNGSISATLQASDLPKALALPGDQALIELRKAAVAAHFKRVEAEVKLSQAQLTVTLDAQRIVNGDPATRAVMAGLIERKIELLQATRGMLPSHPVRKAAERELASIETQLAQGPNNEIPKMASELLARLRSDVEQTTQVENRINRDIRNLTSQIPSFAENLAKSDALRADVARVQDRLMRIQGEMDSIAVQTASGDSVRIFSFAVPPNKPLRTRIVETIFAVFVVALVIAFLVPWTLDKTDPRIHDASTIEAVLGFPAIGIHLRATAETSLFAGEHLRKLVKTIGQHIQSGARSILLAGLKEPVPATLIADIVRTLTESGVKVIFIDGRSQISRDLKSPFGLIGDVNSNSRHPGGVEVVLCDAPALLLSSEAERLAAEASATLLVVQAGKNTKEDLLRAARTLDRIKVHAVGVILDNVEVERAGRVLRSDFKQYLPLQGNLGRFTYKADGGSR